LTTTRIESPGRDTRPALWIVAALPPVLLGAFTVIALALGLFGRHPMWPLSQPNLAEAAATRDAASVVLLMREGDDPNAPRMIRAGVLARGAVRRTPLEAALEEQRLEIVSILLRHGASMTEAQRIEFTCAARRRGDADIVKFFETRGGPVTCGAGGADR
jgi:hypothetical protein